MEKIKGLCYYCEAKYNPTHKCIATYLFLICEEETKELMRGGSAKKPWELFLETLKLVLEISMIAMVG